nr:LEAF RUST 10 DISEASE-RESISTANCE LOCUS RECEPTOR-LIKE PROTEIN KINASE-like 1.1 [Ipomoea batatas]
MAIPSFPSFPTFFFICHVLLFHSSQATNKTHNDYCPEEFPCGGLNTTRFPLTQSSRPDCGPLMVDCDAKPYPKLDWGRDGYDIQYQDAPFLSLSDRKLSGLLQNRSCNSFNRNISFPNSPSVTYRVSSIITLLKCSNRTGDHQFLGLESYHGCEGFSVYFTGFNNVPPYCSVIQLPLKQNETSNNATDLFAMLGSEFFISWFLTENCSECHYRLGGQCMTDDKKTNQFMCVHSSSSSPRKWILVADSNETTQNQDCKDFTCGFLGTVGFPFSESSRPDCGLIKLDCVANNSRPKLDLVGKKYEVVEKDGNFLRVVDRDLERLLGNSSCDTFYKNLSLPDSPVISYDVYHYLTLFRCDLGSDKSGLAGLGSYNKCSGHEAGGFMVFYKQHPYDDVLNYGYVMDRDTPAGCSRIELPIPLSTENTPNGDGPFGFLTSSFLMEWRVSGDCYECRDRGGRCIVDERNRYRCSKGKVNFRLLLRAGTDLQFS